MDKKKSIKDLNFEVWLLWSWGLCLGFHLIMNALFYFISLQNLVILVASFYPNLCCWWFWYVALFIGSRKLIFAMLIKVESVEVLVFFSLQICNLVFDSSLQNFRPEFVHHRCSRAFGHGNFRFAQFLTLNTRFTLHLDRKSVV